jgi:hypothetical protein
MMTTRAGKFWQCGLLALAAMTAIFGWTRPAVARQDPVPNDGSGIQVLTQGPVHEAFAEPVVYDPQPGPVIPKQPPAPIEELPPEEKPEGDDVQWVPGYWAWDDNRNDFLWISGIWRAVPPERQWVPGYWNQADQGFQWVPGVWAPLDQPGQPQAGTLQYLPTPPASIEAGPNVPAPSDNVTWASGCWYWAENRYIWRPGYWVPVQPNWLWVPAHYGWTPGGSLFIDGYWDRPLASRGQMFAPIYFQRPVYARSNFVYSPSVGIVANALLSSLFVRPRYHSYYFGDYYAPNQFQSGIYPWYSYHQSRYGYDPIYAHSSAINLRRDPRWVDQVHEVYRYRRDHPNARPPRTFIEQNQIVNNVNTQNSVRNVTVGNVNTNINNITNVNDARQLVLARSIAQLASNPQAPVRFERLNEGRRRELSRQAVQVRQWNEQRVRQEVQAARTRPENASLTAPRTVQIARSPVAAPAAQRSQGGPPEQRGRLAPPPPPTAPRLDRAARPAPRAEDIRRHEPHPDRRPPEHLQAIRPQAGPGPGRPMPGQPNARQPGQPQPGRPAAPTGRPEAPSPAMKAQRPRSEVPKAERRPGQPKAASPPASAPRPEQPKATPKTVPKAADPRAPAPRPEQPKAVPKSVPKAERKKDEPPRPGTAALAAPGSLEPSRAWT